MIPRPSYRAHLSDAEIDEICKPLTQHAAQLRYLRSLGLLVNRRPDGSPLVSRAEWERGTTQHQTKASKPATGPRWLTS